MRKALILSLLLVALLPGFSSGQTMADYILHPAPSWLTPQDLADIHLDEGLHNMLRVMDYGTVLRARQQGVSVYSLIGGAATSLLREQYECYLLEASRYRVLKAYADGTGRPLNEADWWRAHTYWMRQRTWGLPEAELNRRLAECDAMRWGAYPWRE